MSGSPRELCRWALLAIPLLSSFSTLVSAATYQVSKEYSGTTFFDGWDFYDHYDNLMNGDVVFLSAAAAASAKLAYVDPATNHAIIKVDNTTQVPYNEKRNSVRITSKESYGIGSLWIADIYHAPYGCSVWPSWWSWAANSQWPQGGEIDIFEGINGQTSSQIGLHTLPGCQQTSPKQLSTQVRTTDCAGDNNAGCIIVNTDPASYGTAFAAAKGGIFVTELAESGISIWFFPRDKIPSSITATTKSIDTSTLGTPMGNWPSTGCDISKFFQPQNLVFTITLCGDFAGPQQLFSQTCTGTCYLDYVIKDPAAYSNAYFDIASVRVFSNSTKASSSSGTATSTSAGSGQTNSPSGALALSVPRFVQFLASIAISALAIGGMIL